MPIRLLESDEKLMKNGDDTTIDKPAPRFDLNKIPGLIKKEEKLRVPSWF